MLLINNIAIFHYSHPFFEIVKCMCLYFFAYLTFGPCFAADRGKNLNHFFLFHTVGLLQGDYVKDEFVCANFILWCNVWVMNMRCGRAKGKPDASISILFSKSNKGAARFDIPIRMWITINTTYSFITYSLQGNLEFNQNIFSSRNQWLRFSPIITCNLNIKNKLIHTLQGFKPGLMHANDSAPVP